MKKALRRTCRLVVSVLLVSTVVAGCSDDGAPTDASEKEFCDTLTRVSSDLEAMASASQEEALDAIKAWARDLNEVGTPQDIPDAAREGFELMVEQVARLDADDDLQGLSDELSEAQQEASRAFEQYAADTCDVAKLEPPELPELPAPS